MDAGLDPQSSLTTVKVLIIDDEKSILKALDQVFSDEGYQVIQASSGEEGLQFANTYHPNVVLLDIWLPGLDGIATLEQLRTLYPKLPIIVISGHATIPTAVRATKLGAVDFIEKPLDLDQVLAAVRKALGKPVSNASRVEGFAATQNELARSEATTGLSCRAYFSQDWQGRDLGQHTLCKSMVLYGHGVHSGKKSGLILEPLPPNSGIFFGNLSGEELVSAHITNIASANWATALSSGKTTISTIEHLMSALQAYQICNLLVRCNGEVPVFDGSASEFCRLFEQVGIEKQEGSWYELAIPKTFRVGSEQEYLLVEPSQDLTIDYLLQYPPPIGQQRIIYIQKDADGFRRQIADVRTFGFVKDIGSLQKAGLAQGGRFDNFVLIGEDGVINSKLRYPDEAVRHKVLDLLGDLFLLGRPLRARITAVMTGHSDNVNLAKLIWNELKLLSS